ncbi:MAG: hypothetical protein ACM3PC_03680 [Deltaproteobacteria bacterium]
MPVRAGPETTSARVVRRSIRCAALAAGFAALLAALLCDGAWFTRHVRVPALYLPPPWWLLPLLRGALAGLGALAIAASGTLARLATQPLDLARAVFAVALALCAGELILRQGERGTTSWRARKLELRMGRPDARFGWVLLPSRTVSLAASGAPSVAYAIDAWGDRGPSASAAPDPSLPSLVIAGESVGVGHGLPFEDTFAARLAARLHLQLVNVSAGGYGTDQSLLRLEEALGRLQRPAACVMVFLPIQLQRNVQDYRPRLAVRDGHLVAAPAAAGFFRRLRLRDLWVNEFPVLGDSTLRESLDVTAAALREGARRCGERGAKFVVLVVSVGPARPLDAHPESEVLRELLVVQGLPFVLADVDVPELIPYDGHPGAAASRRIAAALHRALAEQSR